MSIPSSECVYDVVGLGFGPANIAVAGAIVEKWGQPEVTGTHNDIRKVLFIEKNDKFRWHPGMLLPDARMQISFLKDLATLRSPQSPITFLAYLSSQNRLLPFINRGSTIPTRKEFADYLSWAAAYVQEKGVGVKYGHQVVGLDDRRDGTVAVRMKRVGVDEETTVIARNIIISPGGAPRIPDVITPIFPHASIIHSSAYATSIGRILSRMVSRPLAIAVVGSGQSAAEVTMDVRERLSTMSVGDSAQAHEVDMIIRRGSLKPSDDSPFANEIFDPSATDAWFSLPADHMRADRHAEYKSTNYGVVNPRTLEQLYEIVYDQRLEDNIADRTRCAGTQKPRISIHPYSSIVSAESLEGLDASKVRLLIQNSITRTMTEKRYDVVICATGYERSSWKSLITNSNVGKWFGLTSGGHAIHLAPETTRPLAQVADHLHMHHRLVEQSRHESASPGSDSSCSTPPTSPLPATPPSEENHGTSNTLYVSRHYRLIPLPSHDGSEGPKARIYVQGVEEASHGLSDTLLSVLGVRAGEVVADMCKE
ncbi:L-ornithine N(5)-monooxygenase [Pleurotus pulmonarius]